ncbi:hypothetical protein [Dyella sp. ASV21]|uniref:hypothetical protein n=1 Tax=Dyella sp. ASV21 TaxID=2795114 RepID=UPI0018EDA2CA|nr:hypothetical protein [Dyella sp. ASV21]
MDGLEVGLEVVGKLSAVALPALLKGLVGSRPRGKSGKRIHYVVWKEGQKSPFNPRMVRWLTGITPKWLSLESHTQSASSEALGEGCTEESRLSSAQIFLWNGGSEDIAGEDFFAEKPLFIDLFGGEIISCRTALVTDDLVSKGVDLVPQSRGQALRVGSKHVVALKVDHWPPGAGVILELGFRALSVKRAEFRLAGPIRGIKEVRGLGTLWRIDLKGFPRLSNQLTASTALTWVSWFSFLSSIAVLLWHLRSWTVGSWQYWLAVSICVFFEMCIFSFNEKRKQLSKKVCRSLRYWLRPA